MPFWVYILKCSDGSYYTGHIDDIERRLGQHMAGEGGAYTRERRPVQLVFSEYFADRDTAFYVERQIKNWSRAKKEALIARDWDKLKHFAVPPKERQNRYASLDEVYPEQSRRARDERVGWSDGR
jgi:predicted GIY-YIG superfamily endonuclease